MQTSLILNFSFMSYETFETEASTVPVKAPLDATNIEDMIREFTARAIHPSRRTAPHQRNEYDPERMDAVPASTPAVNQRTLELETVE